MALLIHASIRVTGPRDQLEAFQARVLTLLAAEPVEGEFEERHDANALRYEIKTFGIPFPLFALASAENPGLEVRAEWVNPGEGVAGSALISGGALREQQTRPLGRDASAGVYAEAPGGKLALALTCREPVAGVFTGYAVNGQRDALFKLTRRAGAPTGELLATRGDEAAWRERWRLDFDAGDCQHEAIAPEPLDEPLRAELEAMAESFAAEWIWFAAAAPAEIVVEKQRYEARGLEVRPANLRSPRLRELEQAAQGRPLVFDGLGPGMDWLKEVMRECWAESD